MQWIAAEELRAIEHELGLDTGPRALVGVLELERLELHVYRVRGSMAGAWLDAEGVVLAVVLAGEA